MKRTNRNAMLRAAVGCALGFAVVLAWTPARADDDDDNAPDQKFFRSLLQGFGLQNGGAGIEYRERSPLVIPPSRSLPPPEISATASNPSWPVDPEIKKSKEIKAAAKRRVGAAPGDPFDEAARALRPDELKIGTRSGPSREPYSQTENEAGRPLRPGALGYKGGLFGSLFNKNEESAKFTAEPPRASLTDPPVGYQTPSPAQPYGLGKERIVNTPKDYHTVHGTDQK